MGMRVINSALESPNMIVMSRATGHVHYEAHEVSARLIQLSLTRLDAKRQVFFHEDYVLFYQSQIGHM